VIDAHGAAEKLEAGASLVQLYTGLVYQGPRIVRDILVGLLGDRPSPKPGAARVAPRAT
jgi:dihydroorotate dehydrogenase